MECEARWETAMQASTRGTRPPALIKILLGEQALRSLLDSGSSISMVQPYLLLDNLPVVWKAAITCFHRYVKSCPVVNVQLPY